MMKLHARSTCAAAVVAAAMTMLVSAPGLMAANPPGLVDFGTFTKPTNGELVQINLNSDTIAMAMQLAGKGQPELTEALGGLQSVRVNVIGLDDQNRLEIANKVKETRSQLDKLGWQKIVSVQEKNEDVGIYLKTRGQQAVEGVVITVLDGRKEAVFINIAGDLKIEKLAAVGDKLNIDALKKIAKSLKGAAEQKSASNNSADAPANPVP